jgi:hypothetical protein
MGLDITAYSHLKHIGKHTKDPALNEGEPGGLDDYCYYEDHVHAFAYSDFPQSFRGIPVVATRQIPGMFGGSFVEAGCYEVTDQTETHGFRAGSYGGYNQWRADLQAQFNPEREPDGPFYELIWFADNEGSIGPDAAKDLLADFREHADRYGGEDYARGKYQDWTRVCELAAADGLIRFH